MAENLSRNPTCANNTTDWRGGSGWSRQTGQSVGDTGRTTCARATVGSGAWPDIGTAGTMAASSGSTGGKTYSYVAWVRASATRPYRHALIRRNGSGYTGDVFGPTSTTLTADTWTKVRGTGTVPTGGTYDAIGVHHDFTSGISGTLDVGAVRIVEGNVPDLEFADGDTSGWEWNGTAGNSTSQESSGPPPIQITLRAARAATRATRPTLTAQGVFAVRAARAAARATRPLLVGGPLPIAVHGARAQARATQPLIAVDLRSVPTVRLASPPGKSWAFVLGPVSGGYEWEVTNARQRRINLKLRGPSTASFSINGEDPIAERIVELSTDLHVLRDRGDGLREVLYRGRVGSVSDQLGEAGHDVSVPTVDYRGVLERRHLMSGSQVSWMGYDQLWIAQGLIDQVQRLAGGDYGIVNRNTPSGVTRDRNYELGDSIGQRIQELSEVENGFDWEIVPDGPSGLDFRAWHPNRGLDRGVVLEYGGMIQALTRNVDSSDYANHVRVTGQPPEGSSTPPPPHEGVADDIADPLKFPQGRWDKVIGTSIVLTDTLAERRSWLLDHHQVIRPAYTVNLKRGAWRGPDHIWLGDSVRLVIMSGRLKVDETLRVHEIDIALSEAGSEDVTLTLGNPRPNFATRTSAIEKRLEELERR